MPAILVAVTDESLKRLQSLAEEAGVSAEELARIRLEQWLEQPRAEFLEAARYALNKNAELYRRLA